MTRPHSISIPVVESPLHEGIKRVLEADQAEYVATMQRGLFERPKQVVNVTQMEALVLAVIKGRGDRGATADEIALALGIPNTSTRPRCTGLNRRGIIHDSGERRACGGHQRAIVWRVS